MSQFAKTFIASLAVLTLPLGEAAGQTPRTAGSGVAVEIVSATGHSGPILATDLSPDGRLVVSAGEDGTVKLWEAATGKLLRTFRGHEEGTTELKFLPQGDEFVAAGGSSRDPIKLWSIAGGKIRREIAANLPDTIHVLKNGRVLFIGDEFNAELWDLGTGKAIGKTERMDTGNKKGPLGVIQDIAWTPGKFLVANNDGENASRLLDDSSFRVLKTYSKAKWDSVCFVDAGRKFVAVLSRPDFNDKAPPAFGVYDTLSGNMLKRIPITGSMSSPLCLPGDRLAFLGDGFVEILDTASGRRAGRIAGAFKPEGKIAFSADASRLVYGDSKEARLELWDVAEQKRVMNFTAAASSVAEVYPAGANAAIFRSGNGLAVANLQTGTIRLFKPNAARLTSLAVAANGAMAVTGDDSGLVKLWRIGSGEVVREFASHTGAVTSVGYAATKNRIASTGKDLNLRIWNADAGQPLQTHRLPAPAADSQPTRYDANDNQLVKYAADDAFLVAANGEKETALWRIDPASGAIVKRSKDMTRLMLAFRTAAGLRGVSPDSGSGGQDRFPMALHNLDDGKKVRDFKELSAGTASLGAMPDGKSVLVGNRDASINQLDLATGQVQKTFLGHKASVNAAQALPEQRRVISGSDDGSFNIWDSETRQLLTSSVIFSGQDWVTITPEGFFDVSSPKAARNLNVVRGLEIWSIDQIYNALYRPDLVREKLAGDPNGKVKAAAATLDLNKVMASGAAPKITITSPAAGAASATDEITVEATVSDQGGGIGKLEWRVNGITSGIESRGLERVEASAAAARAVPVKRALALERGANHIEVVAYNASGLIASEPTSITVSWDGERTATQPKLFVMAVGVNDYYDSRLRLTYAVPDATAIAEGFRKAGTGLYSGVDVTTVLDSDVTLSKLDAVFTEVGKRVKPRDVFVFFLAGHGKTKNGKYYFLPRDFRYEDEDSIEKTGMDQDKFQAWFARIAARKSILLYDTCESGSLTSAKARGSDLDERLGALNRMTRATGRTFLTATTDDAPAMEGYRGHGVFTYALLDALNQGDINKNGLIEISELADYIDRKVPDYSFEAFKLRQIPQRSIVGNNFALTNRTELLGDRGATTAAPPAGAIPTQPTHVVITPVDVFERTTGLGVKMQQLPTGTLLSLVKTEQGWMLVAKDGKPLGYVDGGHLARVQ